MLEFFLFRIKVYPSIQSNMFFSPMSPSQILTKVIKSNPSAELIKSMTWHVGNVTSIDDRSLYFRVGRITKSTREIFRDGNFEELVFEEAPYTHVLMDTDLELCAIAKKFKLSLYTRGIASQFVRLLNNSDLGKEIGAYFERGEVSDPKDFLSHLRNSQVVSKFWVTFTRPNPFDANEDFIKPMGRLLHESKGERGKTEIEGGQLEAERLEDLARSAAATGDDAGAVMILKGRKDKQRKSLKSNPAIYTTDADIADITQKENMIKEIRNYYKRIRSEH